MDKVQLLNEILLKFSTDKLFKKTRYYEWSIKNNIFSDNINTLDIDEFINESYCFLNNIERPKCGYIDCDNKLCVETFTKGYKTVYCSNKCWKKHQTYIYEINKTPIEIIDYDKLKEKNELYNFILKNTHVIGQIKINDNESKIEKWLVSLNLRHLIPFEKISEQIVYHYLNNVDIPSCPICDKILEFRNFNRLYKKTCSKECNNKLLSISRIGDKNYCHKMTEITKNNWKSKLSSKMKNMILEGSFTPCVTNSWAKSRTKILLNGDIKLYRSTWEAFYQLKNPTFLYEKIRIPYILENEKHTYIVDFVDFVDKILYEIKPNTTRFSNDNNIIKEKFAIEWALENGYKYEVISDDWFRDNYEESLIVGHPDFEKMKRNLKQFLKK